MLREILPQGVVIRLDRGIPLSIFQNGAAEGEETWDEPIMRQRERPPQQHGRHADADPSMSQLVHARAFRIAISSRMISPAKILPT